MKFFKWLSRSREKTSKYVVWLPTKFIGHIHLNGDRCINNLCQQPALEPSPTTFYPPIEKKGKITHG